MEGHNDYVVFDAVGATDHRSEHQQQHVDPLRHAVIVHINGEESNADDPVF